MIALLTDSIHTEPGISEPASVSDHVSTANVETAGGLRNKETAEDSENSRTEDKTAADLDSREDSVTDSIPSDTLEAFDSSTIVEPVDTAATVIVRPAWTDGLIPIERPKRTGNDQGFVTVIVVLMLALTFSVKHIHRIWGTLIRRLWITRSRQDFDHITMVERRTIGLMLIATVFLIGLIATAALSLYSPAMYTFTFTNTLTVCYWIAGYFIFQYIVYYAIGYAFTSAEGCRLWLEGFTASMSMLGLMLILPGLVVVFYPAITTIAIAVSIALYVIARIMFVYKGFKIFFTNFGSILYFILYLCTLEIVPITILINLSQRT